MTILKIKNLCFGLFTGLSPKQGLVDFWLLRLRGSRNADNIIGRDDGDEDDASAETAPNAIETSSPMTAQFAAAFSGVLS